MVLVVNQDAMTTVGGCGGGGERAEDALAEPTALQGKSTSGV